MMVKKQSIKKQIIAAVCMALILALTFSGCSCGGDKTSVVSETMESGSAAESSSLSAEESEESVARSDTESEKESTSQTMKESKKESSSPSAEESEEEKASESAAETDRESEEKNASSESSESSEEKKPSSGSAEAPKEENASSGSTEAGKEEKPAESKKASEEEKPTEQSGEKAGEAEKNTAKAPKSYQGLHVSGNRLVDGAGNPVQLRGVSTHGLAWYPGYVNQAMMNELRTNWNCNTVRFAMYTGESGGYCTGGDQAALKQLVKNGVRYAAAAGMYAIIDWHILSDGNPNMHLAEAKSFFDEMSAEFAGTGSVLYEICNEPNGGTGWADVKAYAEEIIPVIRKHDASAVILVGSPTWSQDIHLAAADPITSDDNVMYTLHFYAATHRDDLRQRMTQAVSAGLPVFVSEFGICDASGNGAIDEAEADRWVAEMNRLGVSYIAWNLSNKNESSALLQPSCAKTSGITEGDLSASGRWLMRTLGGKTGGGSAADAPVSAPPETENTAPLEPETAAPPAFEGSKAPEKPAEESRAIEETTAAAQTENAPAPKSDHEISAGGLLVKAHLRDHWKSGDTPSYLYDLTIQNTGNEALSGWEVRIPFDGNFTLSGSWNGLFETEGNTLVVRSLDHNALIPAGGSISEIGLIIDREIAD